MSDGVVRCVLSGSYRKDRNGLLSAYRELVTNGCQVLSPHRLDFEEQDVLFVRDRAEASFSEEVIERHHLLAITQADFVWLHAPKGYIGPSAAFEIGYALAHSIPVYTAEEIDNKGLRPFTTLVASVYKGIESLNKNPL
ncbi:MAG: hypothetical protein WAQ27_00140 [Candidatus Microsaccharimonas sp.]